MKIKIEDLQFEMVKQTKMASLISNAGMEAINLLERSTGAQARDVVFTDSSVIFVVRPGELGKAIGKQGKNVEKLRKLFAKDVQLVEEAAEINAFAANLFKPAQVMEVKRQEQGDKKILVVKVAQGAKAKAIGAGGERIKRARLLLNRHYGIDEVKIV